MMDSDHLYWTVGGQLAMFFGGASVIVGIIDIVRPDRPFNVALVPFGLICFGIMWLALLVTDPRRP